VVQVALVPTHHHNLLFHRQVTVALEAVVLRAMELGVLAQKVELEARKVILLAELVVTLVGQEKSQTLAEEAVHRMQQVV
jgi:hypothetical protein